MASYTFVDSVFGGHLLSSIVCEECRTCVQRVEPFLDLSLPISDDTKLSNFKTPLDDHAHSNAQNDKQSKKVTKNEKKKQKDIPADAESIKPNDKIAEFMKQDKQLSKHMTKKQQKIAKKSAKIKVMRTLLHNCKFERIMKVF